MLNTLTAWSYETPLEQPSQLIDDTYSFTLNPHVIKINDMSFQKRSDCDYKFDYYKLMEKVTTYNAYTKEEAKKNPLNNELNMYRNYIQKDLWFFVYFIMKNPLANHPFIVNACKEIEAESGDSLQLWARDHLKTTIISIARSCQKILNDPERRIGFFSATRPLAVKIQSVVKALFESPILKACFPDILYDDPYKDAEKWSESPEGGLIVKRKGFYKEPTISSWGLVEGMPTGYHLTDMVFDDIVTVDTQSPETMQKVCDNFEIAMYLGTRDCQTTVVGTFYRHDDPLVHIMNLTDPVTGIRMYQMCKKPATVDGTYNGQAVFLPEKTLAKKRSGKTYFFHCQQLLDPTPRGQEKLNRDHLLICKKTDLPNRLYKFMLIDGAGDIGRRQDRSADAWALGVIGVEPYRDDNGASRVFILDLMIESMDLVTAQNAAVDMYNRNGRILKLGIEKVGMSTTEIHICNALRKKGKHLSIDRGNLVILKPGSRSKQYRIESALGWPFKNGKISILDSIPHAYRERLMLEMEKFPAWHDDGLDMLSYGYDIVKDYRFGDFPGEKPKENAYDAAFRRANEKKGAGWIAV